VALMVALPDIKADLPDWPDDVVDQWLSMPGIYPDYPAPIVRNASWWQRSRGSP
jgi:hypothetical protein